jgi:signal transduction histidine kinase
MQHLFDAFFTTKPVGKGTGLGLHISYNIIVLKHHGRITVESKPGYTCFKIALPFSQTKKQ